MGATNNSPLGHSVAPAILNGARSDTSIAISLGVNVYYKEEFPSPESIIRIQGILASRFPTTCESSAVVPIYSLPIPPTLQAISSAQTQTSGDCVNIMCATDNSPLVHGLAAAMAVKGAHFNTFVAILFGVLLIVIIVAFRRCPRGCISTQTRTNVSRRCGAIIPLLAGTNLAYGGTDRHIWTVSRKFHISECVTVF
jgi:hypothetical protein